MFFGLLCPRPFSFGTCLSGLFDHYGNYESPYYPFSSYRSTFVTLFSALTGAGSFDNTHVMFDPFSQNGTIAVSIIIVYIILSSVILLNLFIARLSNTHDKINGTVKEHLAYHRVRLSILKLFHLKNTVTFIVLL